MPTYFLGVDIGTTGTKALIVTDEGRPAGRAVRSYPMHQPKPGWAEQTADDWWDGAAGAIQDALAGANIKGSDVAGVGLSGQMHSAVFLDGQCRVLRPPILWCDGRTTAQCGEITDRVGGRARLVELTGNPALEGFTAPKILWLKQHERETFEKLRCVVLPKDYVRWRLTGELATDVSDAAGTLLYDVANGRWSKPMLDALDIPVDAMPPVLPSSRIAGYVTREAASLTGLAAGTPVVAGGADNACGAVGAGAVREGVFLCSVGSSGVVLTPSRTPVKDRLGRAHTFNHWSRDTWYIMGVTLAAGLSLRWFRDELSGAEKAVEAAGGHNAYDLLSSQGAQSPAGSRGLFFLPYLNGERTPHADPHSRGVFFGLSGAHTRSDVVRSVFEGVAFSLRDCVDVIEGMGEKVDEMRVIGGGGKSAFWRQILCDVFGKDIVTLDIDEGPAFGAALLAMVGVDRYATVDRAVEQTVRIRGRTRPSPDRRRYEKLYGFYRSLYPAMKDRFDALAKL